MLLSAVLVAWIVYVVFLIAIIGAIVAIYSYRAIIFGLVSVLP